MYLPPVRWATVLPNFSNSPWMRGAPHHGLAWDIFRIRAIVSGARLLRPASRARLFQRQNRANPCRCQWTTVSGWANRRALRHRLHASESQTQKTRSAVRQRGRLALRLRTRSWWRRAAFSNNKCRRDFRWAAARPNTNPNQQGIPWESREDHRRNPGFTGQMQLLPAAPGTWARVDCT